MKMKNKTFNPVLVRWRTDVCIDGPCASEIQLAVFNSDPCDFPTGRDDPDCENDADLWNGRVPYFAGANVSDFSSALHDVENTDICANRNTKLLLFRVTHTIMHTMLTCADLLRSASSAWNYRNRSECIRPFRTADSTPHGNQLPAIILRRQDGRQTSGCSVPLPLARRLLRDETVNSIRFRSTNTHIWILSNVYMRAVAKLPLCKRFRPDGRPNCRTRSFLRSRHTGLRTQQIHLQRNCHNALASPHRIRLQPLRIEKLDEFYWVFRNVNCKMVAWRARDVVRLCT